MVFEIVSEVNVPHVGKVKYTHTQTFDDDSNVFSRISEYREYMKEKFPDCEYRMITAKEKKGK